MKRYLLPAMLLGVLAAAGCYSEEPGVAYSASYGYAGPELAYVAPGVTVVADYDYPVFYAQPTYYPLGVSSGVIGRYQWDYNVYYTYGPGGYPNYLPQPPYGVAAPTGYPVYGYNYLQKGFAW